jgi:two-component system LytT family response regulator
VVGEAGHIDEARVRIEELCPDVVFLDIQMPGGTGFDLLAQLERVPRIVFTTAWTSTPSRPSR